MKPFFRQPFVEKIGVLVALILSIFVATLITPYQTPKQTYFYTSTSEKVQTIQYRAVVESIDQTSLTAKLLDGLEVNSSVTVAYDKTTSFQTLHNGSLITVGTSDRQVFQFYDAYRIPVLVVLVTIFVLIVLSVSRRRGLTSLVGLTASICIIVGITIPLIIAGWNSLFVTTASAFLIATVSMLLAHGFRRQTIVSLMCIYALLGGIVLLSVLVVYGLGLSGLVDETSIALQAQNTSIDLGGILIGGIIIATLGALDDVVTTQVATVVQLIKANSGLTVQELYIRAMEVGKEHIAALVNTLVLVYAGASLPLLVTYAVYNDSLLATLNGAFIATEIARTILVSIGLVLSVPLSTYAAARYFKK